MGGRLKIIAGYMLILAFSGFLIINESCRNQEAAAGSRMISVNDHFNNLDERSAYINFRSFQNSDFTWGFTIFVNSMPFQHYTRIPYRKADEGFATREEAEEVANLFIRMIRNGNTSPKLDRRTVDSLKLTLKH